MRKAFCVWVKYIWQLRWSLCLMTLALLVQKLVGEQPDKTAKGAKPVHLLGSILSIMFAERLWNRKDSKLKSGSPGRPALLYDFVHHCQIHTPTLDPTLTCDSGSGSIIAVRRVFCGCSPAAAEL